MISIGLALLRAACGGGDGEEAAPPLRSATQTVGANGGTLAIDAAMLALQPGSLPADTPVTLDTLPLEDVPGRQPVPVARTDRMRRTEKHERGRHRPHCDGPDWPTGTVARGETDVGASAGGMSFRAARCRRQRRRRSGALLEIVVGLVPFAAIAPAGVVQNEIIFFGCSARKRMSSAPLLPGAPSGSM
ncbi:MAG: hypothetical protein ABIR94_12320 [Rubrivivax sp.]